MRSLPEILFLAIVFYFLYRFIFNFVIPIVRTTRQVKRQFRDMQERAQGGMRSKENGYGQGSGYDGVRGNRGGFGGTGAGASGSGHSSGPSSGKMGEYIDFEEIK